MEPVARRRATPLAIWVAAIVVYWLAIFTATHLPFQTTPTGDPYSLDKLQHLTAFAIFAILLCTAGTTIRMSWLPLYLGVLGSIAAYAAVDELTQRFVAHRTPDLLDWSADLCGAVLGIVAFAAFRRITASRRPAQPPAD